MGLRESVQAISEEMIEFVTGIPESDLADEIRGFVKMLKVALKASEDNSTILPYLGEAFKDRGLLIQNKEEALLIQKKAEKELEKQGQKEEISGEVLLQFVDGPLAGDSIPIAGWPVGSRTAIQGFVYERRERNQLHHIPLKKENN